LETGSTSSCNLGMSRQALSSKFWGPFHKPVVGDNLNYFGNGSTAGPTEQPPNQPKKESLPPWSIREGRQRRQGFHTEAPKSGKPCQKRRHTAAGARKIRCPPRDSGPWTPPVKSLYR